MPGYIADVESEISTDSAELILPETPDYFTGPSFNEKMFNHELSQEFILQYQDRFGRTEQEENYYLVNRQGYVSNGSVLNATQEDAARRDFAQYMAKKLMEYHSERAMQNDPQLKRVYVIKQRMSNMNVSVGPGTKLDMTYDFVAGSVRAQFVSAPVSAYLTVTSGPNEVNFYLRKSLTTYIAGEAGYLFNGHTLRFSVFKDFTPTLSANFTQTVAMTQEFSAIDPGRESLSLAGLKFIF